jgi:serine/threonine protein kinase
MTRVATLTDLLISLFSAEDLRVHLRNEREGDALTYGLPGTGASVVSLFSEAVAALRRFGLVDREFFDGLERVRSSRLVDIRKVRAQWLHNANLDRGETWAEGRYELVSRLGTGGFGIVWKAIDTLTRESVALKILQDKFVDDHRARQRFYRGALVLAELDHPAIVKIRSSVEQEGLRFYYVMEFVDGQRLDEIPERSLEHVWQTAAALAYVHSKQLLHRDIKPSNILVSKGRVKLLDFDTITGDRFDKMTTTVLGTELYAPPEAVDTERKKTSAYDVFGLARTAEFVLRGREPTVAERTASDPVATLRASPATKVVLRAALCADPDARTRSVEQFCADLKCALETPLEPVEESAVAVRDEPGVASVTEEKSSSTASEKKSLIGVIAQIIVIIVFSVAIVFCGSIILAPAEKDHQSMVLCRELTLYPEKHVGKHLSLTTEVKMDNIHDSNDGQSFSVKTACGGTTYSIMARREEFGDLLEYLVQHPAPVLQIEVAVPSLDTHHDSGRLILTLVSWLPTGGDVRDGDDNDEQCRRLRVYSPSLYEKDLTIIARVEADSYFSYKYADARKTHFSFQVQCGGVVMYAYGEREAFQGLFDATSHGPRDGIALTVRTDATHRSGQILTLTGSDSLDLKSKNYIGCEAGKCNEATCNSRSACLALWTSCNAVFECVD